MFRRLRTEQKGSALVLFVAFAGAMMALAALGADMGVLMVERHRMSTVADMAALSGGQLLPEDPVGAEDTARRILTANGYDGAAANVQLEGTRKLYVSHQRERPTSFAVIFSVSQATVAAGTEAWTENLSGVTGAVPLGVPAGSFVLGEKVTLRGAAKGGAVGPGNFQALTFDPTKPGADSYLNHLRYGYPGWIRIGEWIDTEPGVSAGPTREGINYRLDGDPSATWQDVLRGSTRLALVPMLQDWEVNGKDQVYVVGFATFFLESTRVNAGQVEIIGRFIRYVVEGEGSLEAPDFGARTVKVRR